MFDCRHDLTRPEWGRAQYSQAHLPSALFASLDSDLSGIKTPNSGRHPLPNKQDFLAWLARCGVNTQAQIVCYDQLDGMYAARLWWMCRWAGLVNAAVLEGGYAAWLEAGGVPSTAAFTPNPAPLISLPALEKVVVADQIMGQLVQDQLVQDQSVQKQLNQHQVTPTQSNQDQWAKEQLKDRLLQTRFVIVDARAPERYRGEVEPLDALAGHIPGAINHPFKRNINAQGLFVDDLTSQWQSTRDTAMGLVLVHQCGSGVTACHNILAQHVAGLTQPFEPSLLYAGSWSEWCSDPARPVAKD